VERLDAAGHPRTDNPVWLAWVGEAMPPLSDIWQLYCRRFGVAHWFRFAKQRLHWTLPHLSTAKQAERWSDLMPLLSWQLWLARALVSDRPLAKTPDPPDSWASCSIHQCSFAATRHTCPTPQTSRKISGLDTGAIPDSSRAGSHCQKAVFQTQKAGSNICLNS
jgi:hypothetical protein